MSPYLIALWQFIWEWLLAPPLHWALSLSREWQWELGGLLMALVFRRLIVEYSVISVELFREWRAERASASEWYYYGEMEDAEFEALLESLRERAARAEEMAERLQFRAGRLNLGIMRDAARRREQKAAKLNSEVDRLKLLRERIELERASDDGSWISREAVLSFMRSLDSSSAGIAMQAMTNLNRIWASFDWEQLAPHGAPESERRRIVTLLRMMASTSSIAEAQNALRRALQILKQSHNEWQWQWNREVA